MQKDLCNLSGFLEDMIDEEILLTYMNNRIPGLALGICLKEGFPFYCINQKMLDCLGYSNREEFAALYRNSVLNAIHPEERDGVYKEIALQLEEEGEFNSIFRMRKKDGSFVWLEGQGRVCSLTNGLRIIIGYYVDITKLKEQESQLLLYRKASLGGTFLVRLDDDFTLLYGNDIYYKVHEYTPEGMLERIGNRCREYVYPNDLGYVRTVITEALTAGKSTVEWEMRIITGKGNLRWILANAAFEHKCGEVLINGFVIDNTRHHHILEEEARREKWYQIAVSQTSTNVWEYDLENHSILLNEGSKRQHGYESKIENIPESLIQNGYIHPDSWEDLRNMYRQLYEGHDRVEADIKTRSLDKKNWWWERITYTLEYDENGIPYRAVAVGEDITKEKEAELKYEKESQERKKLTTEVCYREQLFDALSYDSDNIYLLIDYKTPNFLQYVSPNLERLLGIKPQMISNNLDRLAACVPDGEDSRKWSEALLEGESKSCQSGIFFRNAVTGKLLFMETQLRKLNINDSKGLLITLNDRTKEKNHEKSLANALLEAEKANKAKSFFLSNMSHDIRTPMNAIIGMTEIAGAHLNEPEKIRDYLKKISLSSRHLLGLVNDILDMSKIESGKMTLNHDIVYLPEVIENVLAIIQQDVKLRNQKFSVNLYNIHHEYFYCDDLRLRQIFLNILSNASKFTDDRGEILFEIEEGQQLDVNTALLHFRFIDTGMGMKAEFLEHIFDAFAREQDSRVDKTVGTGLGMAITRRIVDMLGGTIQVQSEFGSGTTFLISIPLLLAEEPAQNINQPDLKLLIAEENPITCNYLMSACEELGICGDCVNSSFAAVEKVLEADKQKNAYKAVLLNWKGNQQEIECIQKIRVGCREAPPVIIACAYDITEIEDQARSAGVTAFINKPIFRSTFFKSLQKFVLFEPSAVQEEKPVNASDFSGKCFLLAEDNELNREIAMELLSSTGAKIEYASDGAQCLNKFKNSSEGYYDLILMDIQMPVMNGYTATEEIRKLPRIDAGTVPICAMTADAFAEDIEMARKCGMNGHFAKPLDIIEVYRQIGKLLNE